VFLNGVLCAVGGVQMCRYTVAAVKRALYYKYMNHWTYRTYGLFHQAVATAQELDVKVR
jgi:hypothetical protein